MTRSLLLSVGLVAGPPADRPQGVEPVAVVYALTGQAEAVLSQQSVRLRLLDWLPPGSRVHVTAGSLALAFRNGHRYELRRTAQGTVAGHGLTSTSGPVSRLSDIEPLPALAAISEREAAGRRAGAIRVRAETIDGLYPRGIARTLADATILRFDLVALATRYRVEVVDAAGTRVFQAETVGPEISLPSGVLKSGTRYLWRVRTVDHPSAVGDGEAVFETLSQEAQALRAALSKAVGDASDPGDVLLLAAMDERLGLIMEARAAVRQAAERSGSDPALQGALLDLEKRLSPDATDRAR